MSVTAGRAAAIAGCGFVGSALYQYNDRAIEVFGDVLRVVYSHSTGSGGPGGRLADGDMRSLAQQMAALANKVDVALMSRSHGSTVVVSGGGGGGGGSLTKVFLLSLFGGAVYLRVVRGVSLEDVTVCTAATLNTAVGTLGKSLTALNDLVGKVREVLAERIERMGDELNSKVDDVQSDVTDIKSDVDATKALVEQCDSKLEAVHEKQDFANRGVAALCGVVSEMLANAGATPALESLRSFSLLANGAPAPQPRPPLEADSLQPPTNYMPVLSDNGEIGGTVFVARSSLDDRLKAIERLTTTYETEAAALRRPQSAPCLPGRRR
ncbi:hypothetical protein M885DRAFT_517893 [Pelagophyceae sp. CCMP2097]|nr:hypothetical protein M885DRAFT_517893 [Pelagophyceae sp. CCMP2097]